MGITRVALAVAQSEPVVQTVSAAGQSVPVNVLGCEAAMFYFAAATHGTATLVFETSPDSTDGTDGTWFPAVAQRQDLAAAQSTLATASAAVYAIGAIGATWARARVSVMASGTLPVQAIAVAGALPISGLQSVAGTVTVNGPVAEDAIASPGASGFPALGVRAPATPVAATSGAGDWGNIQIDAEGRIVTAGWGDSSLQIQSLTALTSTSDVALAASAGAGVRNFVTDLIIENTAAAEVRVLLRDGTTNMATFTVPAKSTLVVALHTPLRGSAATVVNAQLGAAGTVSVTLIGFKGV